MKPTIKLLFACILMALFLSCSNEAYDNYSRSAFGFKGNVKSITETEYTVRIRSGNVSKSQKINSRQYLFTESGKLSSLKYFGQKGDSLIYNYQYNAKGEVTEIKTNIASHYSPVYNKNGQLISESYFNNTDGKLFQITTYSYHNGKLAEKTDSVINKGMSIRYFYYDTADGIKNSEVLLSDNKKIVYRYDSLQFLALEEHFEPDKDNAVSSYNYSYTSDSVGNWLICLKSEGDKAVLIMEREITYYTDDDIMLSAEKPAITNASNKTGITSIIGEYITDVKERIFDGGTNLKGTPTLVLMIILLLLTILIYIYGLKRYKQLIFNHFSGRYRINGMKRMWMYNKEPYYKVALLLIFALMAFVIALTSMFITGGTVWGFFWIIKILLIILVWVGIIATILGGLLLWGGSPWGLALLIPGAIIWAKDDAIESFGNNLVESGFSFMQNLNLFEWGINLFAEYWDVMLLVLFIPLILFLLGALIVIIFNMLLNGFELFITKLYNISRPCPTCGSRKEPYYLIRMKRHPVALRPGFYGIFYQTSPVNSEKLPTMLINGRLRLQRQCSKCNTIINSSGSSSSHEYGTDIHIGIVGHRSSGKSYLLYSGLNLLKDIYKENFSQIDVDNDTSITENYKRILSGADIQTQVKNRYRAIQVIVKTGLLRPVPYHLYFYDVAGEKFDTASSSHRTAMDFYKNVQSIIFLIDPMMVDYTGIPANDNLTDWISAYNSRNKTMDYYKIENTFTMLKDILEKTGRKSKKIDLTFVCVKTDIGYFESIGYSNEPTSQDIERFIRNEMGLNNLVNSAKIEFRTVGFNSVSVKSNKLKIQTLFKDILKQRGIKV